jgi:hypothetical protein
MGSPMLLPCRPADVRRGADARAGVFECDLVHRLLELSGISAQVPGVDSSDYAACPAHLLMLGRAISAAALAE